MVDTRAWRADLATAIEGRTISGIAVPYNTPTTIHELGRTFDETWLPGSTKESIARRGDRLRVLGFHDSRSFPLGKPTSLEDRSNGMYFEAYIADTRDGNDALELLRIGALDGVSVGFSVPDGGDSWAQRSDGTQERTIARANIREFSLVNFPAFDDARVTAIREAQPAEPDELRAKYTAEDRRRMADNGQAMPDGSYPIADMEDLMNAIQAVGRGSGSADAIRRHIIKRARAMGMMNRIPDTWQSDGSLGGMNHLADIEEKRFRLQVLRMRALAR